MNFKLANMKVLQRKLVYRFAQAYKPPQGGLRAQKQFVSRIKKTLLYSVLVSTMYLIYVRSFNNKIEVICQPSELNEEVVSQIRELRNPVYFKTAYFPLRFMEIIYGNVWDKRAYVEYEREIINCKDGEHIAMGWLKRLGSSA
jgi:hypothetical protein